MSVFIIGHITSSDIPRAAYDEEGATRKKPPSCLLSARLQKTIGTIGVQSRKSPRSKNGTFSPFHLILFSDTPHHGQSPYHSFKILVLTLLELYLWRQAEAQQAARGEIKLWISMWRANKRLLAYLKKNHPELVWGDTLTKTLNIHGTSEVQ